MLRMLSVLTKVNYSIYDLYGQYRVLKPAYARRNDGEMLISLQHPLEIQFGFTHCEIYIRRFDNKPHC